jgi:hypothetical protein
MRENMIETLMANQQERHIFPVHKIRDMGPDAFIVALASNYL